VSWVGVRLGGDGRGDGVSGKDEDVAVLVGTVVVVLGSAALEAPQLTSVVRIEREQKCDRVGR